MVSLRDATQSCLAMTIEWCVERCAAAPYGVVIYFPLLALSVKHEPILLVSHQRVICLSLREKRSGAKQSESGW